MLFVVAAEAERAGAVGGEERIGLPAVQRMATRAGDGLLVDGIEYGLTHRMRDMMLARVALGTQSQRRFDQIRFVRAAVLSMTRRAGLLGMRIGRGRARRRFRMTLAAKLPLRKEQQAALVRGMTVVTLLARLFFAGAVRGKLPYLRGLITVALAADDERAALERITGFALGLRHMTRAAIAFGKRRMHALHDKGRRFARVRIMTRGTTHGLWIETAMRRREHRRDLVAA